MGRDYYGMAAGYMGLPGLGRHAYGAEAFAYPPYSGAGGFGSHRLLPHPLMPPMHRSPEPTTGIASTSDTQTPAMPTASVRSQSGAPEPATSALPAAVASTHSHSVNQANIATDTSTPRRSAAGPERPGIADVPPTTFPSRRANGPRNQAPLSVTDQWPPGIPCQPEARAQLGTGGSSWPSRYSPVHPSSDIVATSSASALGVTSSPFDLATSAAAVSTGSRGTMTPSRTSRYAGCSEPAPAMAPASSAMASNRIGTLMPNASYATQPVTMSATAAVARPKRCLLITDPRTGQPVTAD